MTDEQLLNADPMSLTSGELTKWEGLQNKAMRINGTYEKQLKRKLEQDELEVRSFQCKSDIKLANLANMKATIEMEDIYEDYQEAVTKAQIRMDGINQANLDRHNQELAQKDVPENELHGI